MKAVNKVVFPKDGVPSNTSMKGRTKAPFDKKPRFVLFEIIMMKSGICRNSIRREHQRIWREAYFMLKKGRVYMGLIPRPLHLSTFHYFDSECAMSISNRPEETNYCYKAIMTCRPTDLFSIKLRTIPPHYWLMFALFGLLVGFSRKRQYLVVLQKSRRRIRYQMAPSNIF